MAWTENDKILTTDISYAFTAEDSRQIIAVFIPVLNSNPVQVLPEGTKVYFTWEKESEIASYKLTVYDDAAMTNVIGYQNFDADDYPLTRNLSNSISVVFTGLTEESDYCYSIEAHSESGNIQDLYTGSFTTLSHTDIGNVGVDEHNINVIGFYNVSGRKTDVLQKGINIVRYSDGSTRKMIVR